MSNCNIDLIYTDFFSRNETGKTSTANGGGQFTAYDTVAV